MWPRQPFWPEPKEIFKKCLERSAKSLSTFSGDVPGPLTFRETLCESGRWIDALKKRGRVLKKRGRVLKKRGRFLRRGV